MRASSFSGTLAVLALMAWTATAAYGDVVVPDNGTGTAHMPIHANYSDYGPGSMRIRDGLPAETTIEMDAAVLTAPTATGEQAGGSLGGTQSAAAGSGFQWHMQGTGSLATYSRDLFLPLNGNVASFPTPPAPPNAGFEVHAAPRMLGAPVQSFATDMFRMFGQITGDPDFDLLRIVAGTDFGLPSPGHTTLTQLGGGGGSWAVDSFFDITYRIDFVGAPDGPLAGRSGSTTATIRMATGIPEPGTWVLLTTAALGLGLSWWSRRRRCRAMGPALAVIVLAAMASTARADLVTNSPLLPPAGVYVSPEQVHTTYTGPGLQVILDRVEHRPFADSAIRQTIGPDEYEQFNSAMHGTGGVIVGGTTTPVTLDMNGPVQTVVRGKAGHTTGTFDTEMLSMTLSGNTLLGPMMIRESPTLASTGSTSIADIGGGQYRIDSFFDVFTELSVDGGQTWIPSAGSTHVDLVPEPGTLVLLGTGALCLLACAWRRRRWGIRA